MALQVSFVLTTYVDDGGVRSPQVSLDYPHVLGAVTGYELIGGRAWVENEAQTSAILLPRARPIRTVSTEGVRRFDVPQGCATEPPGFSDLILGRIYADESVIDDIITDFLAAGPDYAGVTLPLWRADVNLDGAFDRYPDHTQAPSQHPDGWFTAPQVTLVEDWVRDNGSAAALLQWVNAYLGTTMTGQEARDWMAANTRLNFTNVLAGAWRQ